MAGLEKKEFIVSDIVACFIEGDKQGENATPLLDISYDSENIPKSTLQNEDAEPDKVDGKNYAQQSDNSHASSDRESGGLIKDTSDDSEKAQKQSDTEDESDTTEDESDTTEDESDTTEDTESFEDLEVSGSDDFDYDWSDIMESGGDDSPEI